MKESILEKLMRWFVSLKNAWKDLRSESDETIMDLYKDELSND